MNGRSSGNELFDKVSDFVTFLGYFGICLMVGGYSYASAYEDSFAIEIYDKSNPIFLLDLFATRILEGFLYYVVGAATIALVAIYIFATSCGKPRLGLAFVIVLFAAALIAASALGASRGEEDARIDKFLETTTRPVVRVDWTRERYDYGSGAYHLLHETENSVFLFEPVQVEGSRLEIHAIDKGDTDGFIIRN